MTAVHSGPLSDGLNPEHDVRPSACLACGSSDQAELHVLNLSHSDLARAGFPGAPVLCLPHYQAALESLGEPHPVGHARYCVGCGAHGPVATWPLTSFPSSAIFACRPCLINAIRLQRTHP